MAKHILENAAAEKEANDVGIRYMNSNDVLSDMIRDYGGALNGVKLHDDAAADTKVRAVGRDGLASGKDVYMREGSLSSGDPAANGLLAHELTHVMQQDGGMQESVDYGEAQGGLISWFKSKFGKKKQAAAAPAPAAPAPAQVAPQAGPTFSAEDQATAASLLDASMADIKTRGANKAAQVEKYNQAHPDAKYNAGTDARRERFFGRFLTGSEEENEALFNDVMTRGDEAMVPKAIEVIRKINSSDLSVLKNKKGLLEHGIELNAAAQDAMNISDLIRDGRLTPAMLVGKPEEGKLSQEEYDKFRTVSQDFSTETGMALYRLTAMKGGGNSPQPNLWDGFDFTEHLSDQEKSSAGEGFARDLSVKGGYDSETMQAKVEQLGPLAKREIQKSSENEATRAKGAGFGQRFAYLRGGSGNDEIKQYTGELAKAGRNASIMNIGHMLTGQGSLGLLSSAKGKSGSITFKEAAREVHLDGVARSKELDEYETRAVEETRLLLENLEKDPQALDALKKAQSLYTGLGTYGAEGKDGKINLAGMAGGKEEAAHRAINDMVLRTQGPMLVGVLGKMTGEGKLSAEEREKAINLSHAMTGMQSRVLTHVTDPNKEVAESEKLSPQEIAMQALYHDFFERNGLLAEDGTPAHEFEAAPEPARAPAPAPAPAATQKPAAPFVPGQGPKETMSYRSDEIGALAADPSFEIDPTSSDPKMMAVIARKEYDKLKALQKSGADHDVIQKAVLDFKEARERMGWK